MYTKEARIYNGRKIVPSIDNVGKLDSYVKIITLHYFLIVYTKNKFKMDQDLLCVRPETVKLLGENIKQHILPH